MPKKGKKKTKSKNSPANTRDNRTPDLDQANTADKDVKTHVQAHDQDPDPPRNRDRSPSHKSDYAPGAFDENDESDKTDDDASMHEAPAEDKPHHVGQWTKDVIREETNKHSEHIIQVFFTSDSPEYDSCEKFFENLNERIRAANRAHDVVNIDNGTINPRYYNDTCRTWHNQFLSAKEKGNTEEGWRAFHTTFDLIKLFNRRHHLPKNWNISSVWAEKAIGSPNPRAETEADSSDGDDQTDSAARDSGSESQSDDESNQIGGLDALEARTQKEQRRLKTGKVLYWWPKGTGSQIFVRYGDRSAPIYRIRAGSHEYYNPSQVERFLPTKTRGNQQYMYGDEMYWKFDRKNVVDILGVGWKVEGDDESGMDALDLLWPEAGAAYPQTRTLVQWRDKVVTLEGRAFIRRISTGSVLDGDRLIYQKARELEHAYRAIHGMDEDEIPSEEDSIPRPIRGSRRHIHFEDNISEETNTESDSSLAFNGRSRNSAPAFSRHHRPPQRRSKPPTRQSAPTPSRRYQKSSKTSFRDTEIQKLEQKLEKLKMQDRQSRRSHSSYI
ncbi:hypothetical protein NUU61_009364 [Penicillium alfredii]|uniref:Uncharacterized protein n=1 Tax=Penicillium alfredii TaxID=1506179 RepID=A0A9W9EN39_9EURO|nr:uncharacterized protein NUU61_009364 [Penicillium alfredii]KAJ5084785.1 hypothetical protein NUU61_009364 [Penicillium alfredii]